MRLLKIISLLSLATVYGILLVLYTQVIDIYQPKVYPDHVHTTLYLGHDFSPEEQEIILEAALEWSQATNHIVEYDVVVLPTKNTIDVTKSVVFVKESPDHPEIMLMDFASKTKTLGLFNGRSQVPYIALVTERLDDENYKEVVLHELGHSLGLEHIKGTDGIGTLMYPYTDLGADFITETDLKKFCELYHCDASKLQH